jgi:hypothetical protein
LFQYVEVKMDSDPSDEDSSDCYTNHIQSEMQSESDLEVKIEPSNANKAKKPELYKQDVMFSPIILFQLKAGLFLVFDFFFV